MSAKSQSPDYNYSSPSSHIVTNTTTNASPRASTLRAWLVSDPAGPHGMAYLDSSSPSPPSHVCISTASVLYVFLCAQFPTSRFRVTAAPSFSAFMPRFRRKRLGPDEQKAVAGSRG